MTFDEMNYEEARELKREWEKLFESDGWQLVEEFIEERVRLRKQQLYDMCPENMEQAVRFARVKGGVEELEYFPEMLKQVLFDLDEQTKDLKERDDAAGEE